MNKQSNCIVCSQKLRGKQTKFCSSACKNKTLQSYAAQKKRGIKRKAELVALLGGKCSRCGYKKNLSALTFHHRGGKEFKMDTRSLSNRTYSKIQEEVKKCQLLCHNCHSEIHHPQLDTSSKSLSRLL